MRTLLEREAEGGKVRAILTQARRRGGSTLFITGPAGIGKSRLVAHAVELGAASGFHVSAVRCGPLDVDLSWGVVKEAIAGLNAPPLPKGLRAAELIPSATFAVAGASAEQPVLLAVDDAHVCDPESLRWLAHLAARVHRLRVVLIVAARSGEVSSLPEAIDAIVSTTPHVLRPHALSLDATTRWTTEILGKGSEELGVAVHEMTAGFPLLIDQLLADLSSGEPQDTDAVRAARPPALRELVAARLRGLDDASQVVAEDVAVFGDAAPIAIVSQITGLDEAAVATAAAALSASSLLDEGVPLSFAHPLVQRIVYELIPPARRQLLHKQAAHLLARDVRTVEQGALHLLAVPPLPDPEDAALLVLAGVRAAERGAHAQAAKLFARALADQLDTDARPQVAVAHARALVLAGEDAGLDAFKQALADTEDAAEIVEVATETAHALVATYNLADACDAYSTAASAAAKVDPVLSRSLLAFRCLAGLAFREPPVGPILEALAPPLPDDRPVRALACGVASWSGIPATDLAALANAALEASPDDPVGGLAWTIDSTFIVLALIWSEKFKRAGRMLEAYIADARRRGALLDLASTCVYRAYADLGLGHLRRASADAELARRVTGDLRTDAAMPCAIELYVLVATGDLDVAEALLASPQLRIDEEQAPIILFLHARAQLHAAQGRFADAHADLRRVEKECDDREVVNPCAVPWRTDLACVLLRLDDRAAALDLARENVELARAYGAPGALGRALRTLAIVDPGAAESFDEAIEVLSGAGMPLLHADALIQLGMRLRRNGHPKDARDPLRSGLDIAANCGARPLAELARAELTATGSRPRRERLTGLASLTPSEYRIVQLATEGRTNRQIAGELFLTLRTIETHLTHAYRKLDVRGRKELPAVRNAEAAG